MSTCPRYWGMPTCPQILVLQLSGAVEPLPALGGYNLLELGPGMQSESRRLASVTVLLWQWATHHKLVSLALCLLSCLAGLVTALVHTQRHNLNLNSGNVLLPHQDIVAKEQDSEQDWGEGGRPASCFSKAKPTVSSQWSSRNMCVPACLLVHLMQIGRWNCLLASAVLHVRNLYIFETYTYEYALEVFVRIYVRIFAYVLVLINVRTPRRIIVRIWTFSVRICTYHG